jgi:BolA protein
LNRRNRRDGDEEATMPATNTPMTERLRGKLIVGLKPTRLDVINESEMHAGHRSSPGTGQSHFRILIVSEAFAGRSRVERHRLVNELLADELQGGIHALALSTLVPGEPIPQAFSQARA